MISPISGNTSTRGTAPVPGQSPLSPLGAPVPGQSGDGFAASGEHEGSDPQKDANTRAIVAGLLGGSHGDGCGCPSCSGNTGDPMAPLRARDQEVEAHENAHRAAAGQFATSEPIYETQTGPDGKTYRVGGHVQVDTTPIANDPKATQDKMNQIVRAALAPADPSGQDMAVASQARGQSEKAQTQLSHPTQTAGQSQQGNRQQGGQPGGQHGQAPQTGAPPVAAAPVASAPIPTTSSKT